LPKRTSFGCAGRRPFSTKQKERSNAFSSAEAWRTRRIARAALAAQWRRHSRKPYDILPDPGDAHVLAAALKTRAAIIVTDNLKDFPAEILGPLNLEARSADDFIADTIALDPGRAVAAVRTMRERFKRPEKTAEVLLLDMEAEGLTETVDVLRPHAASL